MSEVAACPVRDDLKCALFVGTVGYGLLRIAGPTWLIDNGGRPRYLPW